MQAGMKPQSEVRIIARMTNDYSDQNPRLGDLYPAHIETFRERYDRALAATGHQHVLVYSGTPHTVFLDDNDYPFRAAAHFVCWLPKTDLPQSYISYSPGEKPVLIYYQPKDYWHVVPGEPTGYWVDNFDIRIVHETADIRAELPDDLSRSAFIGELVRGDENFGIADVNPAALIHRLHYARGVKTDYELECMRLASRRGVAGHLAAEKAFIDGESEVDIHRAYCAAVNHLDSELPYGNIIALNEHAAVLHYTARDREAPKEFRSFLIDAGAQVHGYASDITRTYCREPSNPFNELIAAMDELQQKILGGVRAGVNYPDLHIETHRLIATVLNDFDIASGSPEALVDSGVTSAFYPHGLGHLLGSQVHDTGGHMADETGTELKPPKEHPFLRLTRTLEKDMVITIEPGLYFIDLLLDELREDSAGDAINWNRVDELKPFGGIRIEDDVRVLDDGIENFTRDAFAAA